MFGAGGEIIKHILFVLRAAAVIPGFAEFSAAADIPDATAGAAGGVVTAGWATGAGTGARGVSPDGRGIRRGRSPTR